MGFASRKEGCFFARFPEGGDAMISYEALDLFFTAGIFFIALLRLVIGIIKLTKK